ncbi:DUF2149 domain-containing protein [Patulibacter sp. S7RM1-6]
MSRVGLGRHGGLDSDVGDPLDSLVNLFDVGIVLAVAFLIAGLSLGASREREQQREQGQEKTLTQPENPTQATGQGKAVGQVYQLPDGRLVLVDPDGKQTAAPTTTTP